MAEGDSVSDARPFSEFLAQKRKEAPLGIDGLTRAECREVIANLVPNDWLQRSDDVLAFVSLLVRRGLAREAFDVLQRVEAPESHLEAQHLRARALAKTGAIASSTALLQALVDAGHTDVETLGLLGSNEKAVARQLPEPKDQALHWQRARDFYADAFAHFGDEWTGINAAAVTLRLGDSFQARRIASQVASVCQARINAGDRADYWLHATLAESHLIRGQLDFARQAYAQAISSHRAEVSAIGTTYRQAREILNDLGLEPTIFDHIFRLPEVVVFSGHRMDNNRASPRLPRRNLKRVAAGLERYLSEHEGVLGYAAAADGADILFLEALLDAGGELHVVLPMEVSEFRKVSVVAKRQDKWRKRFDRIIEEADSVTITGEGIDPGNDAHFEYCNLVTLGLAKIKARELGTQVSGLTVWDGEPGLPGGTGHCLGLWQRYGVNVTVLDPKTGEQSESVSGAARDGEFERSVKSMVFADIVGYSSLNERGIADYYNLVLPQIAVLTEKLGMREVMRDSWGDAFYFVFDETRQAARFALALQQLFRNLALSGSRDALKVRIGVHAGPLTPYYDPIRERMNYTGRHTSKAARTEPIADENQIISTQQFAALLTNEAPDDFELVYAGELSLAKGYGTERMFVLTSTTQG